MLMFAYSAGFGQIDKTHPQISPASRPYSLVFLYNEIRAGAAETISGACVAGVQVYVISDDAPQAVANLRNVSL